MRPSDDDFNSGWNAALAEAERRVKRLPIEKVADDGVRVLVGKPEVLAAIRETD